jgi:hypothetical protein
MKEARFLAHCPFEIGDIVRVKGIHEQITSMEFEIIDLLAIHSCKTGIVKFKAVLNKTDSNMNSIELDIEYLEMIRYAK